MLVWQSTSIADAAHVVVAAGADFDAAVHEVEAILAAAVDHAGEVLGDIFHVGRVDEDAAAGRAAAGHDLHVAAAADDVARGTFEFVGRVAFHVALAERVVEPGARAAEAFFEQAAGGDRLAARAGRSGETASSPCRRTRRRAGRPWPGRRPLFRATAS